MPELIDDFLNSQILYSGLCEPYRDFDWLAFKKGIVGKAISPTISESNRLGKQVENYFRACVEHHPDYELVASNIQVFDENRTLGEFDFILRKGHQLIHVELVYKIYLNLVSGVFVGPNNNDSLVRKRTHLKNNQLPLLNSESGRSAIQALGLDPKSIQQRVLFLGQLFQSEQEPNNELGRDVVYDGKWISRDVLTLAQESLFYIPEKKFWIASAPKEDVGWVTHSIALKQIDKCMETKRSIMLWEKTVQGDLIKSMVTWFSK